MASPWAAGSPRELRQACAQAPGSPRVTCGAWLRRPGPPRSSRGASLGLPDHPGSPEWPRLGPPDPPGSSRRPAPKLADPLGSPAGLGLGAQVHPGLLRGFPWRHRITQDRQNGLALDCRIPQGPPAGLRPSWRIPQGHLRGLASALRSTRAFCGAPWRRRIAQGRQNGLAFDFRSPGSSRRPALRLADHPDPA